MGPMCLALGFLDRGVLELRKTWLWVFQLAEWPFKCVAQKAS